MNPAISTYLDALRVLAAGTVLFGHALGWRTLPHDAVILFFVLSGYLISYTAAERDGTARQFAVNRIARVATVALPAILLGILVDIHVRPLWPREWPDFAPLDQMAWSVGVCVTMSSYVWNNAYPCFSNNPYWSLTYEVWYYLLFGVVFYPKRRWVKIAACCVVLALMGPKIAALLPCWLIGVATYHFQKRYQLTPIAGITLAGSSFAIYLLLQDFALYEFTALNIVGRLSIAVNYQFHLSNAFPLDWLTSILMAVHIAGILAVLGTVTRPQGRSAVLVKFLAGTTFSVYLYSSPLSKLVSAHLPVWAYHLPGSHTLALLISITAAGLAMILSIVTEKQKDKVRALLNWMLSQNRSRSAGPQATQAP